MPVAMRHAARRGSPLFAGVLAGALAAGVATAQPPPPDPAAAPDSAAADTATARRRIVRQFPIEVRSLLHDLRASGTVHQVPAATLRALPVDRMVEVLGLQPGTIVTGEELHVRGGRAGETRFLLGGLPLNEPLRQRAVELPVLALRAAEIVSGVPESRHPGATAGVVDLHTFDPDGRFSGEWRWQSDGALFTRYDRIGARVAAPLGVLGLGAVAAGDVTLDDTWQPAPRELPRHGFAGGSFGWRADNRMLGWLKLAPVAQPRAFTAQILAGREVRHPYDPAWSLDGWVATDPLTGLPVFSADERPGFTRYRAADHDRVSDDRTLGALVTAAALGEGRRLTFSGGWLRTRSRLSAGGERDPGTIVAPQYLGDAQGDPFHVVAGDYPLFRESGSDLWTLRADLERTTARGAQIRAGAGGTYEEVSLWELDALLRTVLGFDAVRRYHAFAPGAFAYGQGRWQHGEMVIHAGLRGEWWTPGPQAGDQTFPATARGRLLLSPRVGFAFPVSDRDVVSFAYARLHQPPARDHLYDDRTSITNRQPLGDAGLRPAQMIAYEAAVKRLLGPAWALQTSAFYRDVARLPGARTYQVPFGRPNLRYTDEDLASAAGAELSLIHSPDERRRIEIHYTLLRAWGHESRPEGDPYGPVRERRATPIAERPLSWDRRHAFAFTGVSVWRRWSWSWSTVIGSPLPWTPKPFRAPVTDLSTVNSRRFAWTEATNFAAQHTPPWAFGLELGFEVRNLFDTRNERAATLDGYPNPVINTVYDDYGAWRTGTGVPGGAYWTGAGGGRWVPVGDPRLFHPPRTMRVSVGRRW
jgi:hypothetical protein